MHGYAIAFVLLAAILHATWNAQLKSGSDRPQFMATMSSVMGVLALVCVVRLPVPAKGSWIYVAVSAVLHVAYNLLLLQNYRITDFGSAYPIARGVSPLLVTLGGFLLMHQRPNTSTTLEIALISIGIVFLSTGERNTGILAATSAVATGAVIAGYTVVDGLGVQRAENTLSYTAWVFVGYLLMPPALLSLRFSVRATTEALPRATVAGLFSLAAYTVVLWATHYADVGTVSALRETSVLWAVVIGWMYLGEPITWRRAASTLMICCGVSVIVELNSSHGCRRQDGWVASSGREDEDRNASSIVGGWWAPSS